MTTSRTLGLGLTAAALLGLAAAHSASAQTVTYDPAASFSLTSNPAGAFSYGETPTLGGAFSLLPSTQNDRGVQSYINNTDEVNINYNPTSQNITLGSQTFTPGGLSIHSGLNEQFGIVRFTAPIAGTYSFTGSFYPGDTNGNSTVNILANGVSVFSGTRTGSNTTPFTNAGLTLAAGDTLDFAVGGSFSYDDSGLAATITGMSNAPVPEASTTVSFGLLLALGFGGIALSARKKSISR